MRLSALYVILPLLLLTIRLIKRPKTNYKLWKHSFFTCLTLLIFSVSLLFGRSGIEIDQLLSISTTLVQVCVALYSVSVASYAFLKDKLKDQTLPRFAIKTILGDHWAILIYTGFLTSITIILGMLNIIFTKSNIAFIGFKLTDFLFSSMCMFSAITIISVLFFVYSVTRPEKCHRLKHRLRKKQKNVIILVEKNTQYIKR